MARQMREGTAKQSLAPGGGPRAALRALDALRAIAAFPSGVSLAELGKAIDIPKSSLLELLRALAQGNYVTHERGLDQLGEAASLLGQSLSQRNGLAQMARPTLTRLSALCEEGASLVEINGPNEVVYRDFVECQNPLQFRIQPGHIAPLHCSSSGLAILAFRPDSEQREFLSAAPFARFASGTPTTARLLRTALADARANRICVTENSMTEGVLAVGSPVFDSAGYPCAAIGVVGPAFRMAPKLAAIKGHIVGGADKLSEMLGFAATPQRQAFG